MLRVMQLLLESPTKEKSTKEEFKVEGRMATKMLHHNEFFFLPGTKVSFMVIVFHVTILDIGLEIAKLMDRRIIQEMEVAT